MSRPRLAVVDHGAGNLVSIGQSLEHSGADVTIATHPSMVAAADGVVLPGVGSTAAVMEGIIAGGFVDVLTTLEVPLLGICVGMQVMFEGSDEDDAECLGMIAGRVRRLVDAPTLPHIGWNDLAVRPGSALFDRTAPVVYFVHSYAPEPVDESVVTATSEHGSVFTAAVSSGNLHGVQFHPERSGTAGLRILARFVEQCGSRVSVA
ncbi:imidazole glycerol phosphate synthase subunit HisH [soil metagenome]